MIVEIDSNEEIEKRHIESFITTNLKFKGVEVDKTTKLIYSYVKPLNIYQVIIFQDKIPNFLRFKSKHSEEIFIDDNYLVVYKANKFYYIQAIDNTQVLEKVLKLLINTLNFKHPDIIKSDKIEYVKKYKKEYIKPISTHSFKLFCFYILFLGFGLYFYDFNIKPKHNIDLLNMTNLKIADEIRFKSISKKIAKIYSTAKSMHLHITFINLKESILLLKVEALEKSRLYEFFEKIGYKNIDTINYDTKSQRYFANGQIKIYRR